MQVERKIHHTTVHTYLVRTPAGNVSVEFNSADEAFDYTDGKPPMIITRKPGKIRITTATISMTDDELRIVGDALRAARSECTSGMAADEALISQLIDALAEE